MHRLLEYNAEGIRRLCIEHNVKSLFAFGSITKKGFKEDSDVDLLVSFMPMSYEDYADNYFNLADKIEELLQRPVDLITEKSLKNPYFINSINESKKMIYEA